MLLPCDPVDPRAGIPPLSISISLARPCRRSVIDSASIGRRPLTLRLSCTYHTQLQPYTRLAYKRVVDHTWNDGEGRVPTVVRETTTTTPRYGRTITIPGREAALFQLHTGYVVQGNMPDSPQQAAAGSSAGPSGSRVGARRPHKSSSSPPPVPAGTRRHYARKS